MREAAVSRAKVNRRAVQRLCARELERVVRRSGLVAEAKRAAPVDRGPLRANIRQLPARRVGARVVVRVVADRSYAAAVHNGSRPHWPPRAPIDLWARRHGMRSGFLVARAIAQRGTPGRPFLTDPLRRLFPGARVHARIRS